MTPSAPPSDGALDALDRLARGDELYWDGERWRYNPHYACDVSEGDVEELLAYPEAVVSRSTRSIKSEAVRFSVVRITPFGRLRICQWRPKLPWTRRYNGDCA